MGGTGGRRLAFTAGGSVEGGLEELVGILVEPRLQIGDPRLQGGDDGQDGRLGLQRHGVPEGFGNWRVRAHTADSTSLLNKEFEPVNGYCGTSCGRSGA